MLTRNLGTRSRPASGDVASGAQGGRAGLRLATSALLAVSALVTLLAWGMASAPGSSPDDNYHMASILCARGESSRCVEVTGDPTMRVIPWEVNAISCYAFHSESSAGCLIGLDTHPDAPSNQGNWNGGYPPLFYLAMSPFVTDDVNLSVFLIRCANAVLAIVMVSVLCVLLPRRRRSLALLPLLVTMVPLGLALVASTNPSGWTVLGVATFWPALLAALETEGRRSVALQVYALTAMLMAAGSRADGCLFVAMSVVLVLGIKYRSLLSHRLVWVTSALCLVVPAYFLLSAAQTSALSTGLGVAPGAAPGLPPVSSLGLAVANFQSLPTLWFGGLGFGPMGALGWLDTPVPAIVGFLSTAVWIGLVFSAWKDMTRVKAFAITLIGAGMLVYPLYILDRSKMTVGSGFQARYLLPLLVILTGFSMLRTGRTRMVLGGFQAAVVVGALSIANLVALYTQIRRYVTGLDVSGLNLDHADEWWWPGPLSPVAVWVIGSVAFTVASALLLLVVRRAEEEPEGTRDPDGPELRDRVAPETGAEPRTALA